MRTAVPEKIIAIIEAIESKGNVPQTRLTVLKKWFEAPGRLPAFGLWIARRAIARKGKTKGEAGVLLNEARVLLGTASTAASLFQEINRRAALDLFARARACQNTYENQAWGPVRIVPCWPLLLVEKGLAIHAGEAVHPSDGYHLAVDWAHHYDPLYGSGLNGPSHGKLQELVQFMSSVEVVEEQG